MSSKWRLDVGKMEGRMVAKWLLNCDAQVMSKQKQFGIEMTGRGMLTWEWRRNGGKDGA